MTAIDFNHEDTKALRGEIQPLRHNDTTNEAIDLMIQLSGWLLLCAFVASWLIPRV